MLRIPWTMRRTNASILEEIGVSKKASSYHDIQMLSYFGHIARHRGNNNNNNNNNNLEIMQEMKRK